MLDPFDLDPVERSGVPAGLKDKKRVGHKQAAGIGERRWIEVNGVDDCARRHALDLEYRFASTRRRHQKVRPERALRKAFRHTVDCGETQEPTEGAAIDHHDACAWGLDFGDAGPQLAAPDLVRKVRAPQLPSILAEGHGSGLQPKGPKCFAGADVDDASVVAEDNGQAHPTTHPSRGHGVDASAVVGAAAMRLRWRPKGPTRTAGQRVCGLAGVGDRLAADVDNAG